MSELPHKHIGVAVIVNEDNYILIDKRLPTGLMANLWEFQGGKIEEGETTEDCIKREVKEEIRAAALGSQVEWSWHRIGKARKSTRRSRFVQLLPQQLR